jgi:hypothetical protein
MTDFPSQHSSALGAQQQHRVLGRKRNAMDPLRKRHKSFLAALFPAVDVHDGPAFLGGKDMRSAHGEPMPRRCALLEDLALGSQWLVLVDEDARIFGDARIRLCVGGYRGDEVLGEHGRGRGRGRGRGAGSVVWGEEMIFLVLLELGAGLGL